MMYIEMDAVGVIFDAEGPILLAVMANSQQNGDTVQDPVRVVNSGNTKFFSDNLDITSRRILNRVFLPVEISGEDGRVKTCDGHIYSRFEFKNGEAFTRSGEIFGSGKRYRTGPVVSEQTKDNLIAIEEVMTDNGRDVGDILRILSEVLGNRGMSIDCGWAKEENPVFDAFRARFGPTIMEAIEMAGHATNEGDVGFAADPGAADLIAELVKQLRLDAYNRVNLSSNEEYEDFVDVFCEDFIKQTMGANQGMRP